MNTIALIIRALKSKAKPKSLVLLSRIPRDNMPGMYEQLRQEAADRDGMLNEGRQGSGKSCRHRTNEAQQGRGVEETESLLVARDDIRNWLPLPQATLAWGSPPPHRPLRAVRGPQEGNKRGSLTGPSPPLIAMSRKRQQSNRLKTSRISWADMVLDQAGWSRI
jgi:hypothetical protein